MNKELFELEKKLALKECKVNSINRKIVLLRTKLEPGAIDYSKVMIESSPSGDPQLETIAEIIELEKEMNYCIAELVNVKQDIQEQYNVFQKFNEYDKQIYIEKKLWRWSNGQISSKHNGITKRTINRIVKKIRSNVN